MDLEDVPELSPPFITPAELADTTGYSQRHIYRLLDDEDKPLRSAQPEEGGKHQIFLHRVEDHFGEEMAVQVARAVHRERQSED